MVHLLLIRMLHGNTTGEFFFKKCGINGEMNGTVGEK